MRNVILLLILSLFISSCKKKSTEKHITQLIEEKDEIVNRPQYMSSFPGGALALQKFMDENLQYPQKAKADGLEGKVVVYFKVRKDSTLQEVAILRGLSPECDAEAMRLISSMPKWTPAHHYFIDVDTYYTIPILFKLNKAEQ